MTSRQKIEAIRDRIATTLYAEFSCVEEADIVVGDVKETKSTGILGITPAWPVFGKMRACVSQTSEQAGESLSRAGHGGEVRRGFRGHDGV